MIPTYDYVCRKHGEPVYATETRPVEERDYPAVCQACEGFMRRILTAPNVVVKAADKAAK